MRLLLDTHTLLWWLRDDPRLGPAARATIVAADGIVMFSVVSLWEIVIKARAGKMRGDCLQIAAAAQASGFECLQVSAAHVAAVVPLPTHHRDPFDHLLIAQAITEDAAFVTADRDAAAYPVRVVACR